MAATMEGRGAQRTAGQSLPSVYTLILNMTCGGNVVDVSRQILYYRHVHRRCYLTHAAGSDSSGLMDAFAV